MSALVRVHKALFLLCDERLWAAGLLWRRSFCAVARAAKHRRAGGVMRARPDDWLARRIGSEDAEVRPV